MKKFHCEVAPYALFDALAALENTRDSQRWIDYAVTSEDGKLFIQGNERFCPVSIKGENAMATVNQEDKQ